MGLRTLRTRVRRLERPACRYSAEDCPRHEITLVLGADDPEPAEADIPVCSVCRNPGLLVVFETVVVAADPEAAARPHAPPGAPGRKEMT
jgi:hypothetical protein